MIENDTWYRCNICGREGRVGRCCSDEDRTPLNDLARAEQERIRGKAMREQLMEMTDTERLNKLESFMRKSSSNGIAMMPLNGGRLFSIDDLAHEDGSNLGEEYCIGETLRDAIDALNLDDAY